MMRTFNREFIGPPDFINLPFLDKRGAVSPARSAEVRFTSSRKIVPLWAISKRPCLLAWAPGKTNPFHSRTIRFQLNRAGCCRNNRDKVLVTVVYSSGWIFQATSSLPVPELPDTRNTNVAPGKFFDIIFHLDHRFGVADYLLQFQLSFNTAHQPLSERIFCFSSRFFFVSVKDAEDKVGSVDKYTLRCFPGIWCSTKRRRPSSGYWQTDSPVMLIVILVITMNPAHGGSISLILRDKFLAPQAAGNLGNRG